MTSFKMIGRDVDSFPTEYRTWVVDNFPDYEGIYYTGLKGGTNPLVDVLAFELSGGIGPVDFNYPQPTDWNTTYAQLPEDIKQAQIAIIGEYVYLFGGKFSDKIYRAPTGRPIEWRDTGAKLPTTLCGSQIAIINENIYLFGGNNGIATKAIYSASLSDPLTWINNGDLLPRELYYSQLLITGTDKYIYLFGGHGINDPINLVFYAELSDPLTWYIHEKQLPLTLYGSTATIINNVIYMLGGMVPSTIGNISSKSVFHIELNDLYLGTIEWTQSNNILPNAMAFSQFVTVGNTGYLLGTDRRSEINYNYHIDSDTNPPKLGNPNQPLK